MYVIVEHEIMDPKTFFEIAEKGAQSLPADLRLHNIYPSTDGTRAVCLWEADTEERVRGFIDETVGHVSNNMYFTVKADKAIGLPLAI